jgi:hypothetical protein
MGVLSNGAIYIAPPLRSEDEDEDDKTFAA